MTQIEAARKGLITDEMRYVAKREDLDAELIRDEVARGRMVMPANTVHLTKRLEPMGIGVASLCKINANIGNSAVTGTVDDELEKLHTAVHLGADTVMDLSTGGNIDGIRQALIDVSPVPIGTVPIYQVVQNVKDPADLTPRLMLDMVEHQAKQGVDYMSQHRQLRRHQQGRRRAGEAAHRRPPRLRHRHGPVHRRRHRRHSPGHHRRLAGADRHRADLPDHPERQGPGRHHAAA